MSYVDQLRDYVRTEVEVLQNLDLNEVSRLMEAMEDCRDRGVRIYICGNGGSAATASHFACDFNKGASENKDRKYKMLCLNDNTPTVMAVANDISYDEIFRFQLDALIEPQDMFIGISGSGNSRNVVKAMECARSHGAKTVAIVGYDGGRLKQLADLAVHVNINNMQVCEDVHMILDHMMMYVISHEGKPENDGRE